MPIQILSNNKMEQLEHMIYIRHRAIYPSCIHAIYSIKMSTLSLSMRDGPFPNFYNISTKCTGTKYVMLNVELCKKKYMKYYFI